VYYYQPADGNFYDANGQWKKLNLSEEDLNWFFDLISSFYNIN
jgi:hypothetical protein